MYGPLLSRGSWTLTLLTLAHPQAPWVEQIVLDHGRVRGVLSEVEAFGPGSGPVLGPVGVRRVEHGRIYL